MKKEVRLLSLAVLLTLMVFLSACKSIASPGIAVTAPPGTTGTTLPTQQSTEATTLPEVPTQPQTEPTTHSTESEDNSDPYIGALYTLSQLQALDNTLHNFGSGRNYNTERPGASVNFQSQFGELNAAFIAEDVPTVYLTFDCGYEYENTTAEILDVLKSKNVKAVFFLSMHYCQSQPQLVQRMIDEGHIIGNHTNKHYNLTELDIEQVVYEIMSLHDYVKENFGYEMTLFRPPSGQFSVRVLAIAQSLGYRSVFWSFAYRDWEIDAQPEIQDAFQAVSSCAHNGCIYLLHSVSRTNAEILGGIIDDLQNRGYTIALFA